MYQLQKLGLIILPETIPEKQIDNFIIHSLFFLFFSYFFWCFVGESFSNCNLTLPDTTFIITNHYYLNFYFAERISVINYLNATIPYRLYVKRAEKSLFEKFICYQLLERKKSRKSKLEQNDENARNSFSRLRPGNGLTRTELSRNQKSESKLSSVYRRTRRNNLVAEC